MRYYAIALTIGLLVFTGCGKEKPTQPQPSQASQGTLFLSKLVVPMIPGGSDTVTISATNPDGSVSNCSISNSDPDIATATLTDSTITITGLTYGITYVTISNGSGKTCQLPVQVYDHHVLDAGELFVSYTDSFQWVNDYSWKPIVPPGFYALGTFFGPWKSVYPGPNGSEAAMMVALKHGSDAIVFADSFILDPSITHMPVWTPLAPPGYVALGQIVTAGWDQPTDSVPCIREDLTTLANDTTTKLPITPLFSLILSFWKIDVPNTPTHSDAYLEAPSFICVSGTSPPSPYNPAAHVLKVDLPMLAAAPDQNFVPKLTSYADPPDVTVPTMEKAMIVPFTMIHDSHYGGDVRWEVNHSPLYVLVREVYYKRLYHYYNQGSAQQDNTVAMTSGITNTESQSIWNETEISISASAGLSFKALSGTITATVSKKFGYDTQTSISELEQTTFTQAVTTPPGKAAALWQEYNKYTLYRHNGTTLEPDTSWDVGIRSFVESEYPDN